MSASLNQSNAFAYGSRLAPLSAAEIEIYARHQRAAVFGEFVAEVIARATRAAKTLFQAVKATAKRHQAIAELNALDDAMLRDIGLNRAEIPAAVDGDLFRGATPVASNENASAQILRLVPRQAA